MAVVFLSARSLTRRGETDEPPAPRFEVAAAGYRERDFYLSRGPASE